MKVGIISIGDELMNGFTVDTNSAWISKKIYFYNQLIVSANVIVGDCSNQILDSLDSLINQNYKYIFISGGLGPTHDDITKKTLCRYFNCKKQLRNDLYQKLKFFFKEKGIKDVKHLKEQCEILENSSPLINQKGTALGMYIENRSCKIFVMPGIPDEMKTMFENQIIPKFIDPYFHKIKKHTTILTSGVYESKLYDLLGRIINEHENKFKVAFLPNYTGVKIRISILKDSISTEELYHYQNIITEKIGKFVYGFNDDKIQNIVINKLIDRKLTIAIAESCTGGMMSKIITDVPGSSKCFLGSIIAYNNKIKENFLNVSSTILKDKGAVSQKVAIQMAKGIKKKFDSNVGIGVTGISGPNNLEKNKQVGLVYIAVMKNDDIIVKKFNLIPQRNIHRHVSTHTALNMLRLLLEK